MEVRPAWDRGQDRGRFPSQRQQPGGKSQVGDLHPEAGDAFLAVIGGSVWGQGA